MGIYKVISIIITVSILTQDIAWASPSVSMLNVESPFAESSRNSDWLREMRERYIAGLLTEPDRERLREHMAGIPDSRAREIFAGTFGLEVPKDTIVSRQEEKQGQVARDKGLCVTGDTLLPILSAGKIPNSPDAPSEVGISASLRQIIDVKPGDYVLSLNEETQQIEPHRINGLLDMGIKPVYKLTTASGRSIRTTANHPYLTRHGWVKVSGLKAGDDIEVPNGHVFQLDVCRNKLGPKPRLELLKGRLSFPYLVTSLFRMDEESTIYEYYCHNTKKYSQDSWKFLKEVSSQANSSNRFTNICDSFSNKFLLISSYFHLDRLYQILVFMSNVLIGELEAAEISRDILWDKIVSIEYIGYEHVYDIEVEGTHNFIGNGIFAHNTYIKKPTSEIIVETGAIRIDEAKEQEILKVISNIQEAEWRVRLADGKVQEIAPININLLDEYGPQPKGFTQERLQDAFNKLLGRENHLSGLEKTQHEIIVRFHTQTTEEGQTRLGRIPEFLPHNTQELVELHPLALLSSLLLQYGLRHELDHAWHIYPKGVEVDLSLEEDRVRMNDRAFFGDLSKVEQGELLADLSPENPNGVDTGGKVYRDLYEIYSRPKPKLDERFSFQPKEPTRIFNHKDHRFAYRYIDEDNPIEMVLGDQMIRIIKSKGELIFLVYHLHDMSQPAVEFKVDTDITIKIGRGKEVIGVIRDEGGEDVGHEEIVNDIDLPTSNSTVSRRHIRLTIEDIKAKRTRIIFEDLTSKNGTRFYSYGQAIGLVQPKVLIGVVKKEEDALTLKKKEMNKFVKRLNFRIGLSEEGWQDRLKEEFTRERDRLIQGLTGDERRNFEEEYSNRFLDIWVENLAAFKGYILFLREMKINLVIRRKGEITEEFRELVQRHVKMLRRIPIGFLAKCREFFPYVISEEQEEMKKDKNLLGYKGRGTHGTVMLRNEGFRGSTIFSSGSLGGSRGMSAILPAQEPGGEEEDRRKEMAVSPETSCAHELYHHLHLEEGALPVKDFIEMLNIADRRRWWHPSLFVKGVSIRILPDVVSIIEEALVQGDEKGKEGMLTVCHEYFMLNSIFYTPAEVVSFCLSHDIGAEMELGSQRFHQIRQIGYRKMLRGEKPVTNRQIPLYEIYTFRQNRHWIDYGDEKGNILIYGNRVIRNDTHKLGENDRRAIEDAVKYKFAETICRDPALGSALKDYIKLLAGIIRDPEAQVFFMDDMEKVLGPVENREQIFKIHKYINDAIYTAGYQISFRDRYEILNRLFKDFNPPPGVDSKGRLVNFLAAIVFAVTLFSSAISSATTPPPARPPVTLTELLRTRYLEPEAKLKVAWDILADTEPDIHNIYASVPVELDPKMTDGAASTNAGEMDVSPDIKVSVPWMEGRSDGKGPKTALYVAMALRHEIQHIIDAGDVTNIFKWWWVIHKHMFGGEERAFDKEQDLLDRYDKKYNLGIKKSLYQRYDIIIDSKYHLRNFWTKISILLLDIFIPGIIFWGLWRIFLRKRFGKRVEEIKERLKEILINLFDRLTGYDDDGGRWPWLQGFYNRIGKNWIGQALAPALIESGLFVVGGSLLLSWVFGLQFAFGPPIIFVVGLQLLWHILHGRGAFSKDKLLISSLISISLAVSVIFVPTGVLFVKLLFLSFILPHVVVNIIKGRGTYLEKVRWLSIIFTIALLAIFLSNPEILFKILTTMVLLPIGDLFAQLVEGKSIKSLDKWRLTYMAILGCLYAVIWHFYYIGLEMLYPGKDLLTAVIPKIGFDQAFFTTPFNLLNFFMIALFTGKLSQYKSTVKENYKTALITNWAFWVPIHLINFLFIPLEYRVLYVGLISLIWNPIFSMIGHGEWGRWFRKKEEPEEETYVRPSSKTSDRVWREAVRLERGAVGLHERASSENLGMVINCIVSLKGAIKGLGDSHWGTRARSIEAVKVFLETGFITGDDLRGKLTLEVLINWLNAPHGDMRTKSAEMIKVLIGLGIIAKDDLRGKLPLGVLIEGLSNKDVCKGSAEAIKILAELGFITREDIGGRLPLEVLIANLGGGMRAESAEAIKSLIESGLITYKDIIGRLPLEPFVTGLNDSIWKVETIKTLIELWLIAGLAISDVKELYNNLKHPDFDNTQRAFILKAYSLLRDKIEPSDVQYLAGLINSKKEMDKGLEVMLNVMGWFSLNGSVEAQNFLKGQIERILNKRPAQDSQYVEIDLKETEIIKAAIGSFRQISLLPFVYRRDFEPDVRFMVIKGLADRGTIDEEYLDTQEDELDIISRFYEDTNVIPPYVLVKMIKSGEIELKRIKQSASRLEEIEASGDYRDIIRAIADDIGLMIVYYCLRQAPFNYPGTGTISFERFRKIIQEANESLGYEKSEIVTKTLREAFIKAGLSSADAGEITQRLLKGKAPLPSSSKYLDKDTGFIPQEIDVLLTGGLGEARQKAEESFNSSKNSLIIILKINQLLKGIPDGIERIVRDEAEREILRAEYEEIVLSIRDGTIGLASCFEKLISLNNRIYTRQKVPVEEILENAVNRTVNRVIYKKPSYRGLFTKGKGTGISGLNVNYLIRNIAKVVKELGGEITSQNVLRSFFKELGEEANIGDDSPLYNIYSGTTGDLTTSFSNYLGPEDEPILLQEIPEVVYLDYIDKNRIFEALRFADGAHCCNSSDPKVNEEFGGYIYEDNAHSWLTDATTFFFQISTAPRGGKQIGWLKCWFGIDKDGLPFVGSNYLYLAPAYQDDRLRDAILEKISEILFSIKVSMLAQAKAEHIPANSLTPPASYSETTLNFTRLQSLDDGGPIQADVKFKGNVPETHEFFVNVNKPLPVADGYIHQGPESEMEFRSRQGEIEENDITGQYKEKLISLIESLQGKAPSGVVGKLKDPDFRIYGFTSIVKGKDDFFLGYYDMSSNKLYLAVDLIARIEEGGLLDEYLLHELICPVLGHYEAIVKQRDIFPRHYVEKPDKGLLGDVLREWISYNIFLDYWNKNFKKPKKRNYYHAMVNGLAYIGELYHRDIKIRMYPEEDGIVGVLIIDSQAKLSIRYTSREGIRLYTLPEETLVERSGKEYYWDWLEERFTLKRIRKILSLDRAIIKIANLRRIYEGYIEKLAITPEEERKLRSNLATASYCCVIKNKTPYDVIDIYLKALGMDKEDLDLDTKRQLIIAAYEVAMKGNHESLKRVIRLYRSVLGKDIPRRLRLKWLIATYEVAMKGRHDSLKKVIRLYGKDIPEELKEQWLTATYKVAMKGNHESLKSVIRQYRRVLGRDIPDRLKAKWLVSTYEIAMNGNHESLRKVIRLYRSIFGKNIPDELKSHWLTATYITAMYARHGSLKEVIGLYRKVLGKDIPDELKGILLTATYRIARNNNAESLKEVIRLYKTVLGEVIPDRLKSKWLIATYAVAENGRHKSLEKVIELYKSVLGDNIPDDLKGRWLTATYNVAKNSNHGSLERVIGLYESVFGKTIPNELKSKWLTATSRIAMDGNHKVLEDVIRLYGTVLGETIPDELKEKWLIATYIVVINGKYELLGEILSPLKQSGIFDTDDLVLKGAVLIITSLIVQLPDPVAEVRRFIGLFAGITDLEKRKKIIIDYRRSLYKRVVLKIEDEEKMSDIGWRSVADSVGLIRELLNSGLRLDDDEFIRRIDEGVKDRPIEPAEINTYIYHGSTHIEQALVELIANAQDAMTGEKSIGRFGVGAYQMFQELKHPEDRIILTTSTDGKTGLQAEFRMQDGRLYYKTRIVREVSKGTRIDVKTRFNKGDVEARKRYIQRRLGANTRGRILVNGELLNNVAEFQYVNGDRLIIPDTPPVQVLINEDGYSVSDSGTGMDTRTFFEKFLVPKEGIKRLEGRPLESRGEVIGETRIFYKDPLNVKGEGTIGIQVSGVVNVEVPVSGINIPSQMIIELPHDAWLPESRNKMSLDRITQDGLVAVMQKLIDLSRTDIRDRYPLINGLAVLINRLTEEAEDKGLLYRFRELCKNLIEQERRSGRIILPNRVEFKALKLPEGREAVYIDETLYDFQPWNIPDAWVVNNFVSKTHRLYIADLDTTGDKDVYIEGRYLNGKGWIILDRRIWKKHVEDPSLINQLFNLKMGYGDTGKELGRIVVEHVPEEKIQKVEVGSRVEEARLKEQEILEVHRTIMEDGSISALLKELHIDDQEFINRKLMEAIRARVITRDNLVMFITGFSKWLSLIVRFKNLLPISCITGPWIKEELFTHIFHLFRAPGNLEHRVVNNRLYFWYEKDFRCEEVYEVDETGKIEKIGEKCQVVFTRDMVFLVKKDKKQIYIRRDGETRLLADNVILANLTSSNEKEYIYLTEEGGRIGINIFSESGIERYGELSLETYEGMADKILLFQGIARRGDYIFIYGESIGRLYKISRNGRTVELEITRTRPGYYFNSFELRDIVVTNNGNVVVTGINREALKYRFAVDFESQPMMMEAPSVHYFSGDGALIYRTDYKAETTAPTIEPRVWVHNNYIYINEENKIKRIDERGRVTVVCEGVRDISDLVFLGDVIYMVSRRQLIKIDRDGNKRELFEGKIRDYRIIDGILYLALQARMNVLGYSKIGIIKIRQDSSIEEICSFSGFGIDVKGEKDDVFGFVRAYDEKDYEAFRSHMGRFYGEYVEVNPVTGDVKTITLHNPSKNETNLGVSVFIIEEGDLEMYPSIPVMVERVNILEENLRRFEGYRQGIEWLIESLNDFERNRFFCSLAVYKDWIPAYIFLEDWIQQVPIEDGLRDIFNRLILESRNIVELRDAFKFINYVLLTVEDMEVASRIVRRWINIYIKNKKLADIISRRMMENFRYEDKRYSPLGFYNRSLDIEQLPHDVRLYLRYLVTEDLGILMSKKRDVFSARKKKGAVINRDLSSLVRLYQKFPDRIVKEDLDWEIVLGCIADIQDSDLEGIRTEICGAVNGQDRIQDYWVRELVQNSRDAIRKELREGRDINRQISIESYMSEEPNKAGYYEWVAGVTDPVGMSLYDVLNFLLPPDKSSKRDGEFSGFIGHGFYTVFTRCDEVRVRTGVDGIVTELILRPSYDAKGDLLNIEVLRMEQYESDFKGTQIQRVNFYKTPADEAAVLGHVFLTSQAIRFLGCVPSTGEDGVTVLFNGEKINEDAKVIEEAGQIKSSISPNKITRVVVDNLYVDELTREYTEFVPKRILQFLLSIGWNIEFPQGTPVPRTRIGLINPGQYAPLIAALALKTIVKLYLEDKDVEIYGLPKDYIYSRTNAIEVTDEVARDVIEIDSGNPERIGWKKYNDNPHLLVQLMTVIDISYNGETTCLNKIKERVLNEYERKRPEDVDLGGVLPKGIEHMRRDAEQHIRGDLSRKGIDIDRLEGEPILTAFRMFISALSRSIDLGENRCDFRCDLGADYSARAGEDYILWNLAYHNENLTPFLDFLLTGELDETFIEIFIHESGHTVERQISREHRNLWTHQAEQDIPGSLGWIMKRLLTKVIKDMDSLQAFRGRFLKEVGFSIEELRVSYVWVVGFIELKKGDVVISSEGTRMRHTEYHRQGRFRVVIRQIAEELGLEADKDGRYDLRKSGSRVGTSHGELRIESDGILVIIDSRFQKDHAGRRQMAVYARNEQKARHELAELREWIGYAKRELGMTDKGIRDGSLNRWMQDKRNIKKVRRLREEFHRKGLEAEKEFNIPFTDANACVEEGILKIDVVEDIERLRPVISNLQRSFSSRKDIRQILGLISPFKIRFLTNASSPVRIYKEGDAYTLELDISSFADWGGYGIPKKLLIAELRRVTASMILDSVETDIPKGLLTDIILILLDSQDINRRYRSGNRKVIAKRSRREYLARLRHDKGRQYVTLIKRLSHTPELEEKVRLIYLYLKGKEDDEELSRLQNFFTKNRGILIRIRLAYNRLERKLRLEPVAPVIARQSGTDKVDFEWPKSLLVMPLYVFIILGLTILSLVSYLSLEPIKPVLEEKSTPPLISLPVKEPVRELPKPQPESFEHTVIPRIPDDCLWHIARKYYAVSSRRIERYIAEYNNRNNPGYKIKDIDLIVDGKRLVLPYRIVHKVRGKNVKLGQVARMYNVSEGYLRAMNPHIPLDGRLQRGDEIEIARKIGEYGRNIYKKVSTERSSPDVPSAIPLVLTELPYDSEGDFLPETSPPSPNSGRIVFARLAGDVNRKILYDGIYNVLLDGSHFFREGDIRLVPKGKETGEEISVTIRLPAVKAGQKLQLLNLLNGKVVEGEFLDGKIYLGEDGILVVNEDINPIEITYTIQVMSENSLFEGTVQEIRGLSKEFRDLPQAIRASLDEVMGRSISAKKDRVAEILATYFNYSRDCRVVLNEGTWTGFLGEVLENEGSFTADCDVLSTYAYIFLRYLGVNAVTLYGFWNDNDKLLTAYEAHASIYIEIDNKWVLFESTIPAGRRDLIPMFRKSSTENIGKRVIYEVSGDRLTIKDDRGKILADSIPLETKTLDRDRIEGIIGLAQKLRVIELAGFIDYLRTLSNVVVFNGTSGSRARGAFAHMGDNGVLYIDSVLFNNDMAIIHEMIHAYLRRFTVEELIAMIDRTDIKNKIKRKAGGNPAQLRHYYARYYLQNPIERQYKDSANEKLTDKIRENITKNILAEVRGQIFIHQDGIAMGTTVKALWDKGVLDMLKNGPVTMGEILGKTNGNAGYLHVAMRLLASQGWVIREGKPGTNEMRFSLTSLGAIGIEMAHYYDRVVPFIQTAIKMDEFLFGGPRAPPTEEFKQLIDLSKRQWDIPEETDTERRIMRERIIRHLDGMLVGPVMVALGMRGAFDRLNQIEGDSEALSLAFELLANQGWLEKDGENVKLTQRGEFAASLATAYGVTVSYLPTFERVYDLLFSPDPGNLFPRTPDDRETHVNRPMNVWGSGGAHKTYFKKIDEIIIEIFNRPLDEQPKGISDMGCGDGTFLIHLYEVVMNKTKRGEKLREIAENLKRYKEYSEEWWRWMREYNRYKLIIVGADLNEEARQAAARKLSDAGVPDPIVIYGDINNPDIFALGFQDLGILADEMLHVRSFLDHNRPYIKPEGDYSKRKSKSTGAFAFKGEVVDNDELEQNLVEHFKRWKPYVSRFGLLILELHTIPSELASQNIGKTLATPYDADHGYSDQYIVELDVLLSAAREAGLIADTRYQTRFPPNELATVSINYFTCVLDEMAGLIDNLGDEGESFRLREAFIKLIKEDGEITKDELDILVKHIENVMKAIDQLTGSIGDDEKREAIIRIALYLSIEEIQRMKELDKIPKVDIDVYNCLREEVARRLGVKPEEIESINPNSTDVAVVINKYFRDKKERQEVAGKVVDIVTRYLLGELEVEKKTENCIKRIIRGKDIKIIDDSSSGVPSMRDRYDTTVTIDRST